VRFRAKLCTERARKAATVLVLYAGVDLVQESEGNPVKIVLFDEVVERHVCVALEGSLRALGHEVVSTGPVWHGHRFTTSTRDIERIDAVVETVLAGRPDALLNFRASALSEAQISRLKAAGIQTIVWLPDDPVLYEVTYRHVVDCYDHVLHCGSTPVLDFYQARGHQPGINMPFWIDPNIWSYTGEATASTPRRDLVFIGNLHTTAKKDRYKLLSQASDRICVYGKVLNDPYGMHKGELYGVPALLAVLPHFVAGLNLPQVFADYAGSAYDFKALPKLGWFDLPSRVIQYAAVGLPVITRAPPSQHAPWALYAQDMNEVLSLVDSLKIGSRREEVRRAARLAVEANFSSDSRARLLSELVSGRIPTRQLSLNAREFVYQDFQDREVIGEPESSY